MGIIIVVVVFLTVVALLGVHKVLDLEFKIETLTREKTHLERRVDDLMDAVRLLEKKHGK